jgi:hypothetical protein
MTSRYEIALHLRFLNWCRRKLGRPERRYLTDAEWREYMRSIIPPRPKRPTPTASGNNNG